MGRIISEDATNIFFPQTCDVLVDDVAGKIVGKRGKILLSIQGNTFYPVKVTDYYTGEIELYPVNVRNCKVI